MWLSPILIDTSPADRTLVLCRTTSSVQEVRREVLRRGGALGLDIMTPTGLALAVGALGAAHRDPDALFEVDESALLVSGFDPGPLPDGHPWAHIAGRRGLVDRLVGHVATANLEGLEPQGALAPLKPLLESGWACPRNTHPLHQLLQRVRDNTLPSDFRYTHVFAVGFGGHDGLPEAPGPQRYHRALL